MNKEILFKKSRSKIINDLIDITTQRYYNKLSKVKSNDSKVLIICIISEVSSSIFDFYVDISRRNNVFYHNINKISEKLIKEIFILNTIYYLYKFLDNSEYIDKEEIILDVFQTFKFTNKDKKMFYKHYETYKADINTFTLDFVQVFSKKIFSSKKTDRMEFIYISHYLESSFNSFSSTFQNLFVS